METRVGDVAESARDGRGGVGGHGENVVVVGLGMVADADEVIKGSRSEEWYHLGDHEVRQGLANQD
jgi:hypothetical protein